MKIVSWNLNGIRANHRNGLMSAIKELNADFYCFQEIKAKPEQFPEELQHLMGYQLFVNAAVKPGYSGVTVYAKEKPLKVTTTFGHGRFDYEGRYLRLDYPKFSLINFYLPHGGRQKENLDYKLEVYQKVLALFEKEKENNLIVIGDYNIAHDEIDLARPKQNMNNIMFTTEERAQLDKIEDLGYLDTFRALHPEGGHYTWWPYMANARERNLGWRIDYCFISKNLKQEIQDASIYPGIKGSDHCPIGIEIML